MGFVIQEFWGLRGSGINPEARVLSSLSMGDFLSQKHVIVSLWL